MRGTLRLRGFSLLEVMTVLVIVAIVVTMIIPLVRGLQSKAERANCTANLRTLYVAADAFVQQQGYWPQIPPADTYGAEHALAWIAALEPYSVGRVNWICPSVQRQLRNPDYSRNENARIDYLATPFDTGSRSPYKWPTQPWFIERGDVHGEGQMLIFANGQIKSLREVLLDQTPQVIE